MTHKELTARPALTTPDVLALCDDGWQTRRYYIGKCRWLHVAEPALDGPRCHLYGAIWYTEKDGIWQRHLNKRHPAYLEQINLDRYRREAGVAA